MANVADVSKGEPGKVMDVSHDDVIVGGDNDERDGEHSGSDIGSVSDVEETLFIFQFDAKENGRLDQLVNDNIQNVEKSIETSNPVNAEVDIVKFDSEDVDRPDGEESIFQSESVKIEDSSDINPNVSNQFEPKVDDDQNLLDDVDVLQRSGSTNSDVEEMLMIRLFDLNRSQSTEVDIQSGREERFTINRQEFKEIDQMTPIRVVDVQMNLTPPEAGSKNMISIPVEEKLTVSRSIVNPTAEKAETQTIQTRKLAFTSKPDEEDALNEMKISVFQTEENEHQSIPGKNNYNERYCLNVYLTTLPSFDFVYSRRQQCCQEEVFLLGYSVVDKPRIRQNVDKKAIDCRKEVIYFLLACISI